MGSSYFSQPGGLVMHYTDYRCQVNSFISIVIKRCIVCKLHKVPIFQYILLWFCETTTHGVR